MNLLHDFYEETCWFLIQLQTYIQKLCLWLESFARLRRTVFIKSIINKFDFKLTDFVLDRIKQKHNKCRDEKRNTREFLYWFTHQELRPVHLTPRWNPPKQIHSITAYTAALEPFKNFNKCTVPYPSIDWIKVKVNIGDQSQRKALSRWKDAKCQRHQLGRRQDKASPRGRRRPTRASPDQTVLKQGNHSVVPRYPWVGKTMEGATPWEGLRSP